MPQLFAMIDGNLAEFAAIVTSDQHRSFHLPLRRIYNLDAQINVSIIGGAAKLCFPQNEVVGLQPRPVPPPLRAVPSSSSASDLKMCFPKPPGFDRAPTNEEAGLPPDKRPWTEYNTAGDKQGKPEYKACQYKQCLCFGPTCCVLELQWCKACGEDADTTCDVLCRCHTNRMKMCLCFGPQCDEPLLPGCCYKSLHADGKVAVSECCECDCLDPCLAPRYMGCQLCCCHVTCVRCMPCCMSCCLCGEEEMIYMDGDLKPCHLAPGAKKMARV